MIKIDKFKSEFNIFLESQLPNSNKIIHKAQRYALNNGGKRYRAYLIFLLGSDYGISKKNLFLMGSAIEMIHAYSLVHDDLPCMDDDELRRGMPTCHKKYNEAQALLVGDGLQSKAFELMSSNKLTIDDKDKLRCIQFLSESIGSNGMVLGQSLDMVNEGKLPNKKTLEEIHYNKTGKLIKACFTIPCIAAKKTGLYQKKLEKIGGLFGLTYQMIDDLLDLNPNKSILGKNPGKDLQKKKITFCSLYGQSKTKQIINSSVNEIYSLSDQLKLPDSFRLLIQTIYERVK
jgi:geranylgeranyl pyrophosphate synthase